MTGLVFRRAREVAFKAALLIFILMVLGVGIIYPIRNVVVDVFADDPNTLNETALFPQILLPMLRSLGYL